jgi:hypothetical protein
MSQRATVEYQQLASLDLGGEHARDLLRSG